MWDAPEESEMSFDGASTFSFIDARPGILEHMQSFEGPTVAAVGAALQATESNAKDVGPSQQIGHQSIIQLSQYVMDYLDCQRKLLLAGQDVGELSQHLLHTCQVLSAGIGGWQWDNKNASNT